MSDPVDRTLVRLTGRDFTRIEMCRHEAGHAVMRHDRGTLTDRHVAVVLDEARHGVFGFVAPAGYEPGPRESKPPIPFDEEFAAEFGPESRIYIAGFATECLSGVAAQFARCRGWTNEHQIAASGDLERLYERAACWSVMPDFWRWWDATVEAVDARWGAIEAVATELDRKGVLTAAELREIIARAPALRNPHRERPWHETTPLVWSPRSEEVSRE